MRKSLEDDFLSDSFIERYLPEFEGMDMSLEQKKEYIKALSNIMQTFVDQAWDESK